MILSSGYATQYRMADVRKRAEYAARAINKMMAETGATMNRIRDKIIVLHKQSNPFGTAPECVGIVLYGHHDSDIFEFSDGHRVPARGRR